MTAFAELPGFWTAVLPAAELGERPVSTVLAGERVVLFRGRDGVGALLDRCPHRGVALSLGSVVDGELQCPFHGWRFGTDGGCTHVPFNPDVARGRLGASALPVREKGGLVWVYTGAAAPDEPHVPEALLRPGVRLGFHHEEWACHWTRAMENMLDTPHLPFVHRSTIGAGIRRAMREDSRLSQEITETPTGFEASFTLDGERPGKICWNRPNAMVLHILDGERLMRMHVWCVPTSADHTRMVVAAAQDFGVLNPLLFVGDFYNRKIVGEDRAVVESSFPVKIPPPGEEQHVPTDKVTLRFRTWFYRHIEGGGAQGAA